MMLNQQQDEHDDQHQADNAAGTVSPAAAPGESAHEEDDQQDEENGGEHDGTPEDLRITRNGFGAFRATLAHLLAAGLSFTAICSNQEPPP